MVFVFSDTKPSTHDFLSVYDKGSQLAEHHLSSGTVKFSTSLNECLEGAVWKMWIF